MLYQVTRSDANFRLLVRSKKLYLSLLLPIYGIYQLDINANHTAKFFASSTSIVRVIK